jgi:hypothetical protein
MTISNQTKPTKQVDAPNVKSSAKPMRDAMPKVTAFIDSMRETFGREGIDAAMRAGLRDGTFWAVEGGVNPAAIGLDLGRSDHTAEVVIKVDCAQSVIDWTNTNMVVLGLPFCDWPRPAPCEAPPQPSAPRGRGR